MLARRLKNLGNDVQLDVLDSLPHGFLNFSLVNFNGLIFFTYINLFLVNTDKQRGPRRIKAVCEENQGSPWLRRS